jgi:flagellar M-ring protein FliF
MANTFSDLINAFLTSPARGRNLFIVVILLLSVAGFGSLIFWNSQPDYQVLFSNLSQEDAGEMTNKLKEKKIPFQLTSSGTTVLVPRDQVYELRLALAADGLPKGGGVGFEVFDRTNLGTTDFVQKLNYQRALQGELSRTIRQIREIEQARVHIVTPKESLFVEEQKKPTASVFVKTRSGMSLGVSQVEGIVHLVASAVEGLEPGNITVLDTAGKILSKRNDTTLVGQLTTTQLEYQRNIEEGLKKKAQGMLEEVLGPNKAIARVSTDIDFQQVDITEERYDPNTVLRSEQKNTERSSASSGASLFSPEAKKEPAADTKTPRPRPNAPSEAGAKTSAGPSAPLNANSSERQHEIRNYEISRINKHIKNPVGKLVKVSAAVVVDGAYKETADAKGKKEKQYAPRSPDEMKNLENIVKKAIGYDEERGDQVEVINMPFYWSVSEEDTKTVKGSPWQEYLMIAYKPIVSLILAFLFILFIVRPLLKRGFFSPGREAPALQSISSPVTSPESLLGPKPPASINLRDQTAQLVREDPSKAVGVVKTWIHEKE